MNYGTMAVRSLTLRPMARQRRRRTRIIKRVRSVAGFRRSEQRHIFIGSLVCVYVALVLTPSRLLGDVSTPMKQAEAFFSEPGERMTLHSLATLPWQYRWKSRQPCRPQLVRLL